MGNDHTPICVICNNPIPANITPTPVASGVVATHQVVLVAHPSCAAHGKAAFEVGKRTIPHTMNTDLEMIWCALDAVQNDEQLEEAGLFQGDMIPRAIDCWQRVAERLRPIPVSERLPECVHGIDKFKYSGGVLAWSNEGWWLGYLDATEGWYNEELDSIVESPTHWLPLPPKPE